MTAGVIQALRALGRTGTPQEQRAWDYLRSLQNDDGGFGFDTALRESNSASTSWVVQAMWAAGIDPARFAPGKGDPLDYLASMQQANGAIRWKRSDALNSIWMTAYAAPAYGGRPLPVTPVARAVRVVAHAEQTTAVPARRAPQASADDGLDGQGGFSTRRGEVISGGGGRGAALFSRPQPQSQGGRRGRRAAHDAGALGARRCGCRRWERRRRERAAGRARRKRGRRRVGHRRRDRRHAQDGRRACRARAARRAGRRGRARSRAGARDRRPAAAVRRRRRRHRAPPAGGTRVSARAAVSAPIRRRPEDPA